MRRIVSLLAALLTALFFGYVAHAASYSFCYKVDAHYDDAGVNSGDYYTNNRVDKDAVGAYLIIADASSGATLWSGYSGDGLFGGPARGCTPQIPIDPQAVPRVHVMMDSRARVQGIELRAVGTDCRISFWDSPFVVLPKPGGTVNVTYRLDNYPDTQLEQQSTFLAAAWALYRHNGRLNQGTSTQFTFKVGANSTSLNTNGGDCLPLNPNGLRQYQVDLRASDAKRKFVVAQQIGRAILEKNFGRSSADMSFPGVNGDPVCGSSNNPNFHANSIEYSLGSFLSGYAMYYAIYAFNRHGEEDCWIKTEIPGQGLVSIDCQAPEIHIGRCLPPVIWPGIDPQRYYVGYGTVLDWAKFFYDLRYPVPPRNITMSNFQILDVIDGTLFWWDAVDWIEHDPQLLSYAFYVIVQNQPNDQVFDKLCMEAERNGINLTAEPWVSDDKCRPRF